MPTLYPWKIKEFNALHEIRIGDILPAQAETPGKCQNCNDPDGLMYAHRILPGGGRVHWVKDNYGLERMYRADLITGPCPECRPTAKVGELPPLPDVGEMPDYLIG